MGLKIVTAAPAGPAKALQPSSGNSLLIASIDANQVLARAGSTIAGSKMLRNDDYYDQVTGALGARYRLLGLKNQGNAAGGNSGLSVGDIHAQPFVLPRGGTIDRLSIETAGAAGAVIRVGIYEATDETNVYPGALLSPGGVGAEGEFDCASAGRKDVDFSSLVLEAGKLYFVAYQRDATAVNSRGMSGEQYVQAVGGFDPALPASGAQILGFYGARVYAAMPATFPAGLNIWPRSFGAMPLGVFARFSA